MSDESPALDSAESESLRREVRRIIRLVRRRHPGEVNWRARQIAFWDQSPTTEAMINLTNAVIQRAGEEGLVDACFPIAEYWDRWPAWVFQGYDDRADAGMWRYLCEMSDLARPEGPRGGRKARPAARRRSTRLLMEGGARGAVSAPSIRKHETRARSIAEVMRQLTPAPLRQIKAILKRLDKHPDESAYQAALAVGLSPDAWRQLKRRARTSRAKPASKGRRRKERQ